MARREMETARSRLNSTVSSLHGFQGYLRSTVLQTERHFRGNSRFHIVRVVGEGGMGVVYEAVDTERGVHVALKTLQALSGEGLLSFKREFRDFQDLEHTNLVNLGELYAEGGQWFFTMELLQGRNFLEAVTGRTLTGDTPGTDSWSDTKSLPPTPTPTAWLGSELSATGVRAPPAFDDAKLREWLRQLGRGLIALHDAGKVHRDIKPSNVLITDQGRVVLLDYGVATNAVTVNSHFEPTIVGTVAYMAPEQAAGRTVGPEADWYSVGAMLFEVLTGQLPLDGTPIVLMEDKQHRVPPLASSLNPAVPSVLDGLCADLLKINPSERPTGRQFLDRLGGRRRRSLDGPLRASSQLVGRRAERLALEQAFSTTLRGQAVNVSVIGASGLGKTMLARQFLSGLLKDPSVVVLSGACFEREAVPYNGVDGLIDSLSLHLARVSPEAAAALVPPNGYLLTKAFPVLGNCDGFATALPPEVVTPDPHELRKQLFAAIRELFVRLSHTCTLVLYIDDLQWLWPDSAALLTELTRAPNAPVALWLTTVRAESESEISAWQPRLAGMLGAEPTLVRLNRLSFDEAAQFARSLVTSSDATPVTDAQIHAVARESGGHPVFIDELMRQATGASERTGVGIDLDEAIWHRVVSLDEEMQTAVTLLSLTPGRVTQATLAQATQVEPARWNKVLTGLRAAHLVRTHGMRSSDYIEPYHDRIRTAVRANVPRSAARLHHRRLAETLEQDPQRDVEALTFHWAEAEEAARAAGYALEAAEKANRALSFDRAAAFYRQSLELRAGEPQPVVLAKLGDALLNAGRGSQAAEAYLEAAAFETPANRLDLQRRAAEQYLRSGHIDRGIRLMTEVLTAVDISTPSTPRGALFDLLLNRGRLRLRGFRFTLRPSTDPISDQKLDATWAASNGFSMVNPILGANFQTQNLLLALKVGTADRLIKALAMEAAFIASEGHSKRERAVRLVEEAEGLLRDQPSEYAQGLTTLVRGVIAFQNGQWSDAYARLANASVIFRERCTGVAWERDTCDFFSLATLFYLGDFKQLQQVVPHLMLDADGRGDLYAGSNVRLSTINSMWLSIGQPELAKLHADLANSRWSHYGYLAHSYYYFVAEVNRLLYQGQAAEAWLAVTQNWAPLRRSLLLRVQVVRVEAHHLRARAAFAVGGEALKAGRASLAVLEREPVPYAAALAALVRCSSAVQDGASAPEVAARLGHAEQLLRQSGMKGYAVSAQWAAARAARDGPATDAALAVAAELGIQLPEPLLRMMGIGKFSDELTRS